MSVGKRRGTDEPLTAHDVAERLDKALLRATRILMDIRQDPTLRTEVLESRYLTNVGDMLIDELTDFGFVSERQRHRTHDTARAARRRAELAVPDVIPGVKL